MVTTPPLQDYSITEQIRMRIEEAIRRFIVLAVILDLTATVRLLVEHAQQ